MNNIFLNYKLNFIFIIIFYILIINTSSNKKTIKILEIENKNKKTISISNPSFILKNTNSRRIKYIRSNNIKLDINIDENLINSICFKYCIKKIKELIKIRNKKIKSICIKVCKKSRRLKLNNKSDYDKIITDIIFNNTIIN